MGGGRSRFGVHLLADPGHAWLFGAPLRYAGQDVFLEEVKDTAMAIYSRDSASRVIERQAAWPTSRRSTRAPARSRALPHRLSHHRPPLALPQVHQEGGSIYALR